MRTPTRGGAIALVRQETCCPAEKPLAFCSQELILLKALWVGSAIFFLLHPSTKGRKKANCLKAVGLMGEQVEEYAEEGEGLWKIWEGLRPFSVLRITQ